MEDFTFSLQLFAEGEGIEAAPAPAPETAPESAAPTGQPEAAPEPEFALRKDPATGRMEISPSSLR